MSRCCPTVARRGARQGEPSAARDRRARNRRREARGRGGDSAADATDGAVSRRRTHGSTRSGRPNESDEPRRVTTFRSYGAPIGYYHEPTARDETVSRAFVSFEHIASLFYVVVASPRLSSRHASSPTTRRMAPILSGMSTCAPLAAPASTFSTPGWSTRVHAATPRRSAQAFFRNRNRSIQSPPR